MVKVIPAAGAITCAAVLLALCACTPALNWREVRPASTRLHVLLPCKPDKAEKTVPLGGQPTTLFMLGCDAEGATFAVAMADLGDVKNVASVLDQWQALTLANMKAGAPGPNATTRVIPLKIPGAGLEPAPRRVTAQGQRADGSAVSGQAAYFAQGSQVFQVVMYAGQIKPEVAETFYASLKFE